MYFLPMLILNEKKGIISTAHANAIYEVFIQEMINLCLGQAMDIFWRKKFFLVFTGQE